jgi:Lactate racemase N-terminal domain
MRVNVAFQGESLELELPEEQLVAVWQAPGGHSRAESAEMIGAALDAPRDFPPLRQTVVPGDHVTIALDPSVPEYGVIVEAIAGRLMEAGVEAECLTVLVPRAASFELEKSLPSGAVVAVHDPADRSQLAYLAATKEGRRIYLNRHLTDADLVVPVGRMGFDPILGYCGPWSILFPGLASREILREHGSRLRADGDVRGEKAARTNREESLEVSWLLGTLFHIGAVAGDSGIVSLVAGRENLVCEQGIAWLDEHWTFRPSSRAGIVVAGVGCSGAAATLEDLAEGLAAARRLVQHGGKIVILSRAAGPVGPALRCLIDAGGAERGPALLHGHEKDDDFHIASRIAEAVAWADVFLCSGMDRELVEDLSMVSLEKPEQARRLVAQCRSATFVSAADWTHARPGSDDDS